MKITDIVGGDAHSLSFEVFPPKTTDKFESVSSAVKDIASLMPSYISVTYGAGGGTSYYTAQIAQMVKDFGVTPLAHLSCISSTHNQINIELEKLKRCGIENILALRGDIPNEFNREKLDFHYAYELIDSIKNNGGFCIGGACYPECHPESESLEKDLHYLKIKVEHGCEFLTTQMFFDNKLFYDFCNNLSKIKVNIPIIAGLMPVTSISQLERIVLLSGSKLPKNFMNIVNQYQDDPISFKKASLEFTIKQARDIYENGFNAVHIYTMNKPEVAKEIQYSLKDLM